MNNRNQAVGALKRRNALTVALAVGLGITGVAYGQATTGTIFGTAPTAAGQTVTVTGPGVSRTVTVGENGRYSVSNLPVGTYTVTLNKGGQTVSSRQSISISVGAGTEVDFAATQLQAVQVNANALPAIDVSTVTSSTIITAGDLEKLPVGRSAEAIALLAPNTVQGSAYFGNLVSFGGSGVAENAYYVNGFNTGDPFKNLGGYSLPYGSISQQQTITGGYGAKYGRSDGGVINQVGKRGTNEWHFGGQIAWEPAFLRADRQDTYYPNYTPPAPYTWNDPTKPGTLYRNGHANSSWDTIYSAYVGGPLIKDKLYFFAAGEVTKQHSTAVSPNTGGSTISDSTNNQTKMYGKVDWNIDDNNVLEGTILQVNNSNGAGGTYNYDYNSLTRGSFKSPNTRSVNNAKYMIAHYTSYISDNATLSVLWGAGQFSNPTYLGNRSVEAFISRSYNQDPTLNGGSPIVGPQTDAFTGAPDASTGNHGLRADFTYVLGDHTLGVGIDNMYYSAHNQGSIMTGPGYIWQYIDPTADLVRKYFYKDLTSMKTAQKAYYLQDVWQATPNLQLNLGVRNDHYINYNDLGLPFVNMKNQWEPRLGFSWDVNGDSSFKVYGNLGRYYLALPNSVAKRAANRSSYLWTYYTYTGIDPTTGAPTGLTQQGSTGSPDGETGDPKDPRQVTATNLRPQYIDELVLGFDKQLGDNWVYGAKATYRKLGVVIDDECSAYEVAAKLSSMGIDPTPYANSIYGAAYCRLINPGQTSNLLVQNDNGSYLTVPMSSKDWGFKQKPKRTYASLNLYLEHPFDGKWYGRVDYTYTYANGNTAGQTRPDFGQADISKTEDWDAWQLMDGATGELLNTRKHVIKARGAYQITPEWLVSGTAIIASGTPQECLGYFGPAGTLYNDPTYYGPDYHWCNGQKIHPGSNNPYAGHTPWSKQINLAVRYTPSWGDNKLAFKMDVFNVLNSQTATQTDPSFDAGTAYHPYYGTTTTYKLNNTFHMPVSYTPPRYVRISVSYDY